VYLWSNRPCKGSFHGGLVPWPLGQVYFWSYGDRLNPNLYDNGKVRAEGEGERERPTEGRRER
jgi:hypothetical protein